MLFFRTGGLKSGPLFAAAIVTVSVLGTRATAQPPVDNEPAGQTQNQAESETDGRSSAAAAADAADSDTDPASAPPAVDQGTKKGGSGEDASASTEGSDEETASDDAPQPDLGQGDLDEAVLERIEADSAAELRGVVSLLESALAKGLSDENESFARKMLGSVQLQLGKGLAGAMVRVQGRRQAQVRDEAIATLERAVENDPSLAEAHLLIARLNLLPGGDKDAIAEAATRAIELLGDEPEQRSTAYVLRALTRESDDEKMEDLNAAIEANPSNAEALQARAALRMQRGNVDGAVNDLESVLGKDPTNQAVAQAAVNQLVELNRSDEALKLLSKTIEAQPSDGLYRLRAILYRMQGEEDKALEDLNKALAMEPKDPVSLLQRAEISIFQGDVKSAKQDLQAAIDVAPQIANAKEAIYVRCLIASEEGRTADAINDMKQLVQGEPENVVRRLQLANLYREDGRPRRAIDTLSAILQRDPDNPIALRYRADTLLGVGEHAEAVEDYEKALQQVDDGDGEEAAGILNNLAWVLATSPEEELRDGARAVELAERAANLTEYKQAHVLSTLAAAHAEAGDFKEAVRWSEKSVEIARGEDHEQLEQLEEELESFRNREPWRERQQTEENEAPLLDPEDLIDT